MAEKVSFSLPKGFPPIEPVFVLAPTARNGITLIQRLLNSSNKIIIYGENKELIESVPNQVVNALNINAIAGSSGALMTVKDYFLSGSMDGWTSNLIPDPGMYAATFIDNAYRLAMVYQESAREYGYSRWGMKHPMIGPETPVRLQSLFPAARIVFLYRNLFDVARSAKARKFCSTTEDFASFGAKWQKNLLSVISNTPKNTLVIRHEDLVAQADVEIGRLEEFLGITGINRRIMERKINTFTGSAQPGYSPSGYIAPEALGTDEITALKHAAREALELTRYTDAA
jgi:hypothetical protein